MTEIALAMQEASNGKASSSGSVGGGGVSKIPVTGSCDYGNRRCAGQCGVNSICSDAFYYNGYCANPAVRAMWLEMEGLGMYCG